MAASPGLVERIDELVSLFNRRSLDLPDRLLDRRTEFLLNGVPFEAMLGRDPRDPLVLMIARGPAGYRFAIKALQHALPDARVERGALEGASPPADTLDLPFWLSGHLRGTDAPLATVVRARLQLGPDDCIVRADLAIEAGALDPLREARYRE